MKIFLDTEFYEHQPKAFVTRWVTDEADGSRGPSTGLEPLPGANAVQLISLGAVREDGAEFYAENSGFDWDNVPEDHWLQENVRPHLMNDGGDKWISSWYNMRGEPHFIAKQFFNFSSDMGKSEPEFWGYFCDYDWVVLCGLYGRMIDLPPEFPMFCLDLKQEMHRLDLKRDVLPAQTEGNHHALADARWIRDAYVYTRVAGTEEL